ncbi:MAG: phosphatase PAP2 family protein [Pseudonocardiales bacterium]
MPETAVTKALNRRLVARRLYPLVLGLAVGAAAVVAGLGADYTGGSWAARLDRAADGRVVARFGAKAGLMRALADLGSAVPVLLVICVLVISMLALGRVRGAMLACAGPSIAILITEVVLKPLVARTGQSHAYPSGHATAFCAVAVVVIVLALDQRPRRAPRSVQVIVCGCVLTLVGCVAVALVAAGYHVASDVVGGLGVALVTVLTVALVIDGAADRRTGQRSDSRISEIHRTAG